jgi:hypothetical protein
MAGAQQAGTHRNFLLAAAEAWNRFWFAPADPTTLGLIRICCGILVLYVHLCYTYDLQTIFGPHAWTDAQMMKELREEYPMLPRYMSWAGNTENIPAQNAEEKDYMSRWEVNPRLLYVQGHPYLWSIWFYVTNPTPMLIIHGVILTFMFCFMIGLCTRIMAVLTWAGMLCYIQRGVTTLFGLDAIMVIVVLYLMIGPSGAALSVDRLIARYWAAWQARRKHLPVPHFPRPTPSVSANLAIRLLQVHFCIIYFVSGTSKLQGPMWWSGNAVWMTMANYEFSPMGLKWYMEGLRYVAARRWLWELITTGGTYFTLAFEISFPYLVWTRWGRPVIIASAVFMHLGIAVCMGLVTFSMIMLTGVLAFVPPEVVQHMLGRIRRSLEGWYHENTNSKAETEKVRQVMVPNATSFS